MKKITVASGPAAAAPLAPLADAGTASAAPVPEKATGSVTCDVNHGQVTGTVKFDGNKKTGGSLDCQASNGMWLHGVVTPGSYQEIDAQTADFAGEITSGRSINAGRGQRRGRIAKSPSSPRAARSDQGKADVACPDPTVDSPGRMGISSARVGRSLRWWCGLTAAGCWCPSADRRHATDQAWRCGSGIAHGVVVVALSGESARNRGPIPLGQIMQRGRLHCR